MKILIVGGHSSLAQVLRPILASFAEVLTAGRSECDLELDLTWSSERLELPAGVDAVIQLAAHFGGQNFDSMLAAEDVNVLGSLKLAYACSRAKVSHLVYLSSIFAGLGEESPFYSNYALSKRHAEELVRLYCRSSNLPLVILRPSQVYGEGESFRRHQPFLYALMDQAQRGEDIVLHGENDALRNFIHVSDVAEIIACVVQKRIEGRYDCASLSNIRFSELATAAITAFASASKIRFDATKPDIPDNAFEADKSLYQLIDYFPKTSMLQGMAREASHRKVLA